MMIPGANSVVAIVTVVTIVTTVTMVTAAVTWCRVRKQGGLCVHEPMVRGGPLSILIGQTLS